MRAALLQQTVLPCRKSENLSHALLLARTALAEGAKILVYPELFLTGFCYEPVAHQGVRGTDAFEELDPFRDLVRDHDCLIIGSVRRGRSNLGFCLDRSGLYLRAKIHPFGEEKRHFDGGDTISPISTPWGLVGLEICYDLRFPEVARSLALQGADLLVTVAQFPRQREEQWRALCIARAVENQIPHLACNWADGGGSMIITARGLVVAGAEGGEEIIMGEIDPGERDEVRGEIPCFADRRPQVYLR
ncbi:MAG: nitrilase [Methanothrix sp.]|jgi:predicted amidohydrolase|uniref:nitrilase-related carbon-nitrogen hydrolase n=1 Tax=Methanothrix sp. TaxID=90426 RepID=UPI001BD5D365|nr:nitrilase-related carbon-nitrogen hydrolase [Methanothrix sp.]MBK7386205.1 nitrilase [Methanothrix sp.]HPW72956.1 nitrilase-related carbon-nitrogen hydrolase [Methanothrix sp.]